MYIVLIRYHSCFVSYSFFLPVKSVLDVCVPVPWHCEMQLPGEGGTVDW